MKIFLAMDLYVLKGRANHITCCWFDVTPVLICDHSFQTMSCARVPNAMQAG